MKFHLLGFLLSYFCLLTVQAQTVIRHIQPILANGKTIHEHKKEGNVVEEISYGGKLILAKLTLKGDTLEYYRIDDWNYLYREYCNTDLVREGSYKLSETTEPEDTITTYDPDTYQATIQTLSTHLILEEGPWTEYDGDKYWQGEYKQGKKTGNWRTNFDKNNPQTTILYNMGIIEKYYYPDLQSIQNNIGWITDKSLGIISSSSHKGKANQTVTIWQLEERNDRAAWGFGHLKFLDGGKLQYEFLPNFDNEIGSGSGSGTWKLTNGGELALKLNSDPARVYTIFPLGKDGLYITK